MKRRNLFLLLPLQLWCVIFSHYSVTTRSGRRLHRALALACRASNRVAESELCWQTRFVTTGLSLGYVSVKSEAIQNHMQVHCDEANFRNLGLFQMHQLLQQQKNRQEEEPENQKEEEEKQESQQKPVARLFSSLPGSFDPVISANSLVPRRTSSLFLLSSSNNTQNQNQNSDSSFSSSSSSSSSSLSEQEGKERQERRRKIEKINQREMLRDAPIYFVCSELGNNNNNNNNENIFQTWKRRCLYLFFLSTMRCCCCAVADCRNLNPNQHQSRGLQFVEPDLTTTTTTKNNTKKNKNRKWSGLRICTSCMISLQLTVITIANNGDDSKSNNNKKKKQNSKSNKNKTEHKKVRRDRNENRVVLLDDEDEDEEEDDDYQEDTADRLSEPENSLGLVMMLPHDALSRTAGSTSPKIVGHLVLNKKKTTSSAATTSGVTTTRCDPFGLIEEIPLNLKI